MARFFIHRPVFAIVVSLVMVLAGAVAMTALPISQYPDITPPTVQVVAVYPGAAASVVEQTVAAPIEEEVNGVEGMIYMQSKSANDGSMVLTVTFAVGQDSDIATVNVQNAVARAQANLPPDVIKNGITVTKQSTQVLMYVSVFSPENTYDTLFMSNYVTVNVINTLKRVPGVGDAKIAAGQQDYAMRFWVRPDYLSQMGLTSLDVVNAINEQNLQAPAGGVGQQPQALGLDYEYSVTAKGRLELAEEFKNIIIRTNPDGSILRAADVCRVDLGASSYTTIGRRDGAPAIPIAIYQQAGANALQVADQVKEILHEMSRGFPDGLDYEITFDYTTVIEASIEEVIHTLGEAFVLVLIVVLFFLGNFRATLIPMLAVPVSLVGTFASFAVMGFSINVLTMLAMVLAIGIVVDDAIIVVEATEHHIGQGLDPVAATEKAMDEVSGPVMAVALVLTSVFVPVAFLGGITGEMYKQFAITLSVSVILSAIVALTMTPALCAMILKPRGEGKGWIFGLFDAIFNFVLRIYMHVVRLGLRFIIAPLLVLGAVCYLAFHLLTTLPTGFLPPEDLGYLFVNVQLPDAASLERTDALSKKIEDVVANAPGVANVLSFAGVSILTGAASSNAAAVVAIMKPWDDRTAKDEHIFSVLMELYMEFSTYPEALILVFNPPPIPGLGTTGGFTFELQDRQGGTPAQLQKVTDDFMKAAGERPELTGLYTSFRTNVPQIRAEIDREQVKVLGVALSDVFYILQTNLGGLYVNQFNRFGRTWRVYVQAEADYRRVPQDIKEQWVRSAGGDMVPFSAVIDVQRDYGPDLLPRYNLYRAAEINGDGAPGISSGQALKVMEEVAAEVLPDGYGYEWTGTAYQERESSGQQGVIFALAMTFVFLFLAALYESWTTPLAVLLITPCGVAGAFGLASLVGLDNNLYVQVGLIMLIGLVAKNAILIVEFAKMKHEDEGYELHEAAIEAAELRFRPILMTAFAFLLGVLPLVFASGAGASANKSVGLAVFGGMGFATLLGVFITPALYVAVQGATYLVTRRKPDRVPGTVKVEVKPPETPAPKPKPEPKSESKAEATGDESSPEAKSPEPGVDSTD